MLYKVAQKTGADKKTKVLGQTKGTSKTFRNFKCREAELREVSLPPGNETMSLLSKSVQKTREK